MIRQSSAARRPNRLANRKASPFSKQSIAHAARVMAPIFFALAISSVAHAQGTMDFSGAQTLMGTFKSKNPMVLGFQGKGQLEDIYGRLAEVMLSQPATKIFMRTGEPKAAEWISESIGKVEIERLRETKFDGSRAGKNFTVDRQVEPLVMASEIGGLEDRHAYLKLGNNVARFVFEYLDSPGETPEFIPRKAADDELKFDRRTLAPRRPDSPKSDKAFAEEQPTTSPSAGSGRAYERGSGSVEWPATEAHELRPGSERKQAMTASEAIPTSTQPGSALDIEQSEQLALPPREKHHDSVTLELGHS